VVTASSKQFRRLRLGLAATAAITGLAWLLWGSRAVTAALVFGLVATTIQIVAARIATRLGKTATPDEMQVYVIGMALRVLGVAAFGIAVTLDRATFPPGAAALGYLGTLLPLMWLETRLA
jgi:hypothetical protein